MNNDVQSSLQRLTRKCSFLVDRFKTVDAERRQAVEQVNALNEKLYQQSTEIEKLRTELEYLRVSSALTPGADDVERTRAIIADMVRDIDRCIAELKE